MNVIDLTSYFPGRRRKRDNARLKNSVPVTLPTDCILIAIEDDGTYSAMFRGRFGRERMMSINALNEVAARRSRDDS
ncbi:hypothetical protein [Paraburkholderia antibiotica]|uniref:Uncharacterized protein n=1 Tax=Paraburkholderia antibiotica TaxID=2728839 RepID=A0A7Y0A132_9BURK|nr:hypothetical protein [Paraburkholderia antibiotica]NML34541.1 hypothetical protein [Paraburkholderia antibiotica]